MPPRRKSGTRLRTEQATSTVLTPIEEAKQEIARRAAKQTREDRAMQKARQQVRSDRALSESLVEIARFDKRAAEDVKRTERINAENVLIKRARPVPKESVLPMTRWDDAPGLAAAMGVITGIPVSPVESHGKHMLEVYAPQGGTSAKPVSARIHVTPGLAGEANVHELSHGKWTGFEGLPSQLREGIGQTVWNLIEDARISKRASEWFNKPVLAVQTADIKTGLSIQNPSEVWAALSHEIAARAFGIKPNEHKFTSATTAVTELGSEIDEAADSDDPRKAITVTMRVLKYVEMLEDAQREKERVEQLGRNVKAEQARRAERAEQAEKEAAGQKADEPNEGKSYDEGQEDGDAQPDDGPEGENEEDEPSDGEYDVPDGAAASKDEDESDESDGSGDEDDTDEGSEGDGDAEGDADSSDDVDGTGSGLTGNPAGSDTRETPSPSAPAEVGEGGEAEVETPTLKDLDKVTKRATNKAEADFDKYEETKERALTEAEAGSRFAFGRHLAPDNPLYHGHEVTGWPTVERDTIDHALEDRMKLALGGMPDEMDIPKKSYTGSVTPDVWKLNTGNAKVFAKAPKSNNRLVMLVDMSGSMLFPTGGEIQRNHVLAHGRETGGYIAWQVVAAIEQQYPDVEVFGFWTGRASNHLIRLPQGKRPRWPQDDPSWTPQAAYSIRGRAGAMTGGNADCTALLWLREYLGGDMATTTAIVVSDGHPAGGHVACNEVEHAKAVAHQMRDDGIRYASILIGYDDTSEIYPAELKTVMYDSEDFDKIKDLFGFLNND